MYFNQGAYTAKEIGGCPEYYNQQEQNNAHSAPGHSQWH